MGTSHAVAKVACRIPHLQIFRLCNVSVLVSNSGELTHYFLLSEGTPIRCLLLHAEGYAGTEGGFGCAFGGWLGGIDEEQVALREAAFHLFG